MQLLREPGLYETLNKTTQYLTNGLKKLAEQFNLPLQIHQVGSLFGLFFTAEKTITNFNQVQQCNIEQFKKFFHGMLEKGIYLAPSAFESGFVSTAHTHTIIEETLKAAHSVIANLET